MSIRRRTDNEMIPKRDITLADESRKTVVVSLWNDLATGIGQELLDMADQSPVIAIKSLKVGDFQGMMYLVLLNSMDKSHLFEPFAHRIQSLQVFRCLPSAEAMWLLTRNHQKLKS